MRAFFAAALVVVATVLAPFVITAAWGYERTSDVDAYVETVAPLAEEPELRDELADELGVATVAALEENLPFALPDQVDQQVADAAEAVVRSPGFPEFWREANRDLHAEFMALAHDGTDADDDAWVRIDISPLFQDVLERLAGQGLSALSLPEMTLEVPLVRESTLLEQRDNYLLLEDVARIGPWVVGGLLLAAVVIAPGVRGRLRTAGFGSLGIALAAGVTMLASGPLSDRAAEEAEQGRSGLVRLITEVVLESLGPHARNIGLVALAVGIVLLLASYWSRRARG
ncbi:hypothetical protein [Nocardioides sambongensis]|uniref:hypothetical protein n=1 Tax=Nocardioides sambongensis TaxID=2589074 RepID=UPI00112AE4B3|nr:hypothetical protein [Nocardioides sambongensis]